MKVEITCSREDVLVATVGRLSAAAAAVVCRLEERC